MLILLDTRPEPLALTADLNFNAIVQERREQCLPCDTPFLVPENDRLLSISNSSERTDFHRDERLRDSRDVIRTVECSADV